MWRGVSVIALSTRSSVMPCSRSFSINRRRVRSEVMPMPRASFPAFMSGRILVQPNALHPLADRIQRLVSGQVDVDGCHRDIAAPNRVEVGARPVVLLATRRPDPVKLASSRVFQRNHVLGTMPVPQSRGLETLEIGRAH